MSDDAGAPDDAENADALSLLEQAEAEAAEAEAAAAQARARVRAMRSRQGAEPTGRPRRLRRPAWPAVAKALAAIVIVCSLAGAGYIVWQHHSQSVRHRQSQEFIETAKRSVVALTSLDYKHVKEDVQKILDGATGGFKDDFASRADDFIKVAETSKVVSKGTVTAAGVESMTDDSAVVLVVGTEEIANAAGNQQPRSFRFRVTVSTDGDQQKVSKLELVL